MIASETSFSVVIYSSLAKDAELTLKILATAGISGETCASVGALAMRLTQDVGALVLASEILPKATAIICSFLETQPAWSDLPIIVLAGEGSGQTVLETTHGRLRNVTVFERPVRIVTLVSGVRSAVSARQRQYEVRGLMKDLERSKIQAEEANHSKSAFLANMSHEIRTPLGIILGYSEFLANECRDTDETRQWISTVRRNGEDLTRLINDLLDLSKVEAEHLELERLPLRTQEILDDLKTWFRRKAEEKGLQFGVKILGKLPEVIETDPTRLGQILKNIVGNAIKFTHQGTVEVHVNAMRTNDAGNMLRFAVHDTGCGIDPAAVARLFKPFIQADASTTRNFGGTGLGLVLSRRLARALGGDVQLLENAKGGGSTFVVTISSGNPQFVAPLQAPPLDGLCTASDAALENISVLVAEDAPDNQLLIRRILNRRGIQVDIANNGSEAVEKATKKNYDVILMDVQMPILDGYAATKALRERGFDRPILALSAHAMKAEMDRSLSAGCDAHLTKPINAEHLVRTVAQFARRGR